MIKVFNEKKEIIFLGSFLSLGFFIRLKNLFANYSFWNDEEQVAIYVRAILEKGKPVLENGYTTKFYQFLYYWLNAFSAKIFGLNEFALRFPSVIFGVLTIWAVYLLAKELFDKRVGLVASFFTAFLNIEILMSRQARPYQALQLFSLLSCLFLYKTLRSKKLELKYFFGFLLCGVVSSLMHGLSLLFLASGLLAIVFLKPNLFKNWRTFLSFIFIAGLLFVFKDNIFAILSKVGEINNIFYYKAFLKNNYPVFVILAFLAFPFGLRKKKREVFLCSLFIVVQFLAISFFLKQPFIRYFYPAFLFLIILSAFSLVEISKFFKRFNLLFLGLLVFLVILATPNKFSFLPKTHYSLNEDMQEIPEVDYKKIYGFIKPKLEENPEAIYISNWNDHPVWYLGEGNLNYLLRKNPGNLAVGVLSGAEYLDSLDKLKKVIKESEKGLILLESWESELPEGTKEFIRENMHKEFEVDRLYSVQPRYWPVEVYSWGISNE